MPFEVFKKGSAPIAGVPSVTIQKRGLFSLNESATRLIGDPAAVQFLWDPENRLIGLKPVPEDDPNAYPVRLQASAKARQAGRRGVALIAGSMFTRFIELDTTTARRWVPQEVDGVLVVDLKSEGQEVVGNRSKRSSEATGDE